MPTKEQIVQEFRIRSIQEAALRVIARKGMAAATMQEIAKEAGIAKGTIYLYFRDRDTLVEQTFETAIGELHKRVDAALALDVPFEEKLRALVDAQLTFFGEHAEFFRLYSSLRMPEGTPAQQRRARRNCQSQYQARVERFAEFLRDGMEQGAVRRTDPYRLALFLIDGTVALIFERLREESPRPQKEDVDFLLDVMLAGISTRTQKRG